MTDQIAHKRRLLNALLGEEDDDEDVAAAENNRRNIANKNVANKTNDANNQRVSLIEELGLQGGPSTPDRPLLLLGHSIGAYVNLKLAAERLSTSRAAALHLVCLFPTFRDLYSGLAPGVKVCVAPGMRQVVANVLHYAPKWLSRW